MSNFKNLLISQYNLSLPIQIKLIREGQDNNVFLIKPGKKPKKFVFRESKRNLENDIYFELEFIKFLFKRKFPVFPWVRTKSNKSFIRLQNNHMGVLFKFAKGLPLKITPAKKPNLGLVFLAGQTLGKLHNLSLNIKINFPRKRTIFTELKRVVLKEKDFKQKYQKGEKFINQVIEYINWAKLNLKNIGIIHNDYRAQNILFYQNKISAVVDFDWCCSGPLIKDLALGLVEWSFPDKAENPWQDVFDAFLKGYNQKSPVKVKKNKELYEWICFSSLSDAATYFCDLLKELKMPKKPLKSYMYNKFCFFKKLIEDKIN